MVELPPETTLLCPKQSNVVSGGNSTTVAGGSISYSIGQIAYKSTTGSTGQLNEGVQQPLEIYTLEVQSNEAISNLFKVYPNPVSTSFQLQIDDFSSDSFIATLYTLEGKIIFVKTVYSGNQEISIEELPHGTYLLNLLKEDTVIKRFKIIKN